MSESNAESDGDDEAVPSPPTIDDTFLAGIVHSSFHPFAVLDGDGTILFLSRGISDLLGAPAEHFMGANMLDVVAPSSQAQAIQGFQSFTGTGSDSPPTGWAGPAMTINLRHIDGHEVTCRALAVPSGRPNFGGLVLQVRGTQADKKLDEAIASIAQGEPIATTLGLIIGFATEQMPYSVGVIGLDHDGESFGSVVAHPAAPDFGDGASWLPFDVEPTPWRSVALGHAERISIDTTELPEPVAAKALDAGLPGCWAFSLSHTTRTRDVLVFWRRAPGTPGPHLTEAIERIIRLVQLAVEASRARELLQQQANTDELTGLANRAALVDRLERLRDDPPDDPIGILYCDLDDFKPINDQLGHMVGDQVLAIAARRISSAVRDGDLAVRIGGDEFAVLCLRTSAESMTQLADRLIASFSTSIAVNDREVDLGISIGLALVDPSTTAVNPERILARADAALLRAKAGGKGHWRASEPT